MHKHPHRPSWLRLSCVAILVAASAASASPAVPWAGIGRAATPAELRAWDIDVRGDFQGLPPGSGSVDQGTAIWEVKCASCHGEFGESNQVFTPLVGGTSKKDIESGRVFFLAHPGYPHRTTLMKVSKLSTLWDYIHRAMPWNAPKSLSSNDVYAVLAYLLNLGDIVPADFTLSDRNIAEIQKRMPNRDGHVFFPDLWEVRSQGDVHNTACMKDCPVDGNVASELPLSARNQNGNLADQVRPFGEARGTDTAGASVAVVAAAGPVPPASAAAAAAPPPAEVMALLHARTCSACHAVASRVVGPAFRDVAKKYAGRAGELDYLARKMRSGGQGVWGPVPMPEQPQLQAAEAAMIARWIVAGAP